MLGLKPGAPACLSFTSSTSILRFQRGAVQPPGQDRAVDQMACVLRQGDENALGHILGQLRFPHHPERGGVNQVRAAPHQLGEGTLQLHLRRIRARAAGRSESSFIEEYPPACKPDKRDRQSWLLGQQGALHCPALEAELGLSASTHSMASLRLMVCGWLVSACPSLGPSRRSWHRYDVQQRGCHRGSTLTPLRPDSSQPILWTHDW
jgi:hypothetical protein